MKLITILIEPVVLEDAKKYIKENDLGTKSRFIRHLIKTEIYNERSLALKHE